MPSIQRILLVGGATIALSVAAITVSASSTLTNTPVANHAGKVADDLVRPDSFSHAGKQLDDQVSTGTPN